MSDTDHSNRRVRRDLAWVLSLTLLCYSLSSLFEVHERYNAWLSRHERWQADELPLSLLVLACGLAWFAFRRRHDAQQASRMREEARATAAELLQRNRELARDLLVMQEKERAALARELHDEMGQRCMALRIETSFLRHCQPGDLAGMMAAAQRADAAASSLYQLVKDLLLRLRPAHLDTLGLVAALQDLCEGWAARSGLACSFEHGADKLQFDDNTAMAVYRVTQEALTNVYRHAQARKVRVSLALEGARLALRVQDDGVGMPAARPARGLGLLGAAERAAALGGELHLDGAPGAGLRLTLWLPFEPSAPAQPSTAFKEAA